MIVPDSAIPWITQHRTAALGDPKSAYGRLIREDFEELEKHLPARATSVLDIGCGLAGIDTFLYDRYGRPNLHLLDGTSKTDSPAERINFHPEGMQPFNDMLATRELLVANDIDPLDIYEWPVGYSKDPIPCDLCISLLSWGWHYPISTYLDLAWRSLVEGGRLILDVRATTGGEHALDAKGFKRLAVIRTTPKGWRLCYERPKEPGLAKFKSGIFD